MKTKLLFTAMVLMGLTSANATTNSFGPPDEGVINTAGYRSAEPVMFMERGVEFLIFPDGSFDFNTNPGNSFGSYNDSYYYRESSNTRRGSINTTQGAPGTVSRWNYYTPSNAGILIQHDFDGKVRRIGNVYINYDRSGRVKRIGTVYMSYNRRGWLTQVGGLHLTYNRWGQFIHSYGVVNHLTGYYEAQGHDYSYGTYGNYNGDEDSYYYRKADSMKKQETIKK